MITLDGKRIPGKNIMVRGSFKLAEKDLSGQSSSTKSSEEGIKPQVLHVSLLIPHNQSSDLTRLIALAQSVDSKGARKVYHIVNTTASSANIRKVKFSDNFTYKENAKLRLWNVSFTLKEVASVPEKKEKRQCVLSKKKEKHGHWHGP